MADDGLLAVGPDDCDNVESGGGLGETISREEGFGGFGDLVHFEFVYLFFGGGIVVGAGFDFHEDEGFAVAGDDVDFSAVDFVVAGEDFVAQRAADVARGDVFALIAQGISAFAFGLAGRNLPELGLETE